MPAWLTKEVIKIGGYALIGLVSVGGLYWGYSAARNYFIGVENLHTELSNERDRANRAEVSLGALQQTLALSKAHDAEKVRIRAESQEKIDQIRAEIKVEMAVLTDRQRFEKVTMAKPKLVERLANRATEKIFVDLENTFNQ